MLREKQNPVMAEIGSEETRQRMVRVALGILRENAEAEDAAHDAVEQALRGSAAFRAEARVATWLHRVVVNAALMRARRLRRAAQRTAFPTVAEGREERDAIVTLPDTGRTPVAQYEEHEQRQRLHEAVDSLPRPYRDVVRLCVFDELPLPEVARSLGITRQAVRTRMCRARAQLKERLAA
jgi:RNA polymerase sigma-70 factor (ECF subfamily)